MTPPTVNAYYSPSMNDINFPAGILQPPFFDPNIDPAVNFGGIGVVIGHEMTHGFDDQGSKYDGNGNLREWQTADDRKKFVERTDCEVAEYGGFEAAPAHDDQPQQKLNGKLTLGENTADNGGLRIAYMALLDTLAQEGKSIEDKIDGYTEKQRYFLGFAQVWCENQRAELRRVRRRLRMQEGPADVPGELLPGVVAGRLTGWRIRPGFIVSHLSGQKASAKVGHPRCFQVGHPRCFSCALQITFS